MPSHLLIRRILPKMFSGYARGCSADVYSQTSKYPPLVHMEQLQFRTSYSGSGGESVAEKEM